MASLLADQIGNAIEEVDGLYHRLVLLVAPHGNGKTDALREVAADSDEAGRGFRFEAGHDSDLKPATVPI